MPTVKDVLEQVRWLLAHNRADEPAKLLLPRIAAKRRAANKEKRHRIIFDVDETTYAEFHTEKERIMQALGENPTLFGTWLCEVMGSWSDEMLENWVKAHAGE